MIKKPHALVEIQHFIDPILWRVHIVLKIHLSKMYIIAVTAMIDGAGEDESGCCEAGGKRSCLCKKVGIESRMQNHWRGAAWI